MVPGGRVRLLELPDGKRAVFLRAMSAIEWQGIQAEVLKLTQDKQLYEMQVLVASKCTLLASFTALGRLTDQDLRGATAGLAPTLHTAIWDLSDFVEPSVLDQHVLDF